MKKLISFLFCLIVGLFSVTMISATTNQPRGKPSFEKLTVTIQPFQEQAEFERDVGNPKWILIFTDEEFTDLFGESKVKKRQVVPRLEPETVYRN